MAEDSVCPGFTFDPQLHICAFGNYASSEIPDLSPEKELKAVYTRKPAERGKYWQSIFGDFRSKFLFAFFGK